ncbi:M20/M25/M40 family metallo-hydrolase [uncultured Croceitalea sp.]|uniref:M20/M25/M40 family metallo-hydrolase n=1 Tax=uncultured Croceitalea sp. TaxID=1798908 RepID=UPI00374E6BDA
MKFTRIIALLLLALAVYYSFKSLMPSNKVEATTSKTIFSTKNALTHVKQLSVQPHAVGFNGHSNALTYIIGELKNMGLQTITQEGYTAGDWGNLSKATNILARIKGTENGKALMLMSHYDSNPHSSFGASDAASGVATILEGIRAFLEENKSPKNDIIILITDAEELGLNGADLFVNNHPWARDVGLVLNFEARGSGGPSYMLIETNRGNGKLIKEFTKANPEYPVANSLAYSIYKMLPNDTDLTVFREDGDIDGFNFAFIDDHYDYHTALDNYDRLDRNSLAHQGSYLMPLLNHFSVTDLNDLKSLDDYIYFNVPFFRLISYPFEWIWPMFAIGILVFAGLLILGFRKNVLQIKPMLLGFVPLLLVLIVNGFLGYISWPSLKWWYPDYKDMLHGFTYNGHIYILQMTFLALGVCFFIYNRFKKTTTPNLLVAPIFIWLVICGLVAFYLEGASFFIVPVFGLLAAFLVCINQEKPNALVLLFLALPGIFIHAPFVKMFPVGLGLKMMTAATVFVTLIYFIVLPLLRQIKAPVRLTILCFLLFVIFGISAHLNSEFSEDKPKPSSLLYVYDADKNTAKWATYDNRTIGWNGQFFGDKKKPVANEDSNILSSKYSTSFTYVAETEPKSILPPRIDIVHDSIVGLERLISLCITPQRDVNRLEVFTNTINLNSAKVNNIRLSEYYLKNRRYGKLITHYISNNDFTEIELSIPKEETLELTFFEASNDLLTNKQFSVPERPRNSIPMPFVLNDAILVTKTLKFE